MLLRKILRLSCLSLISAEYRASRIQVVTWRTHNFSQLQQRPVVTSVYAGAVRAGNYILLYYFDSLPSPTGATRGDMASAGAMPARPADRLIDQIRTTDRQTDGLTDRTTDSPIDRPNDRPDRPDRASLCSPDGCR